MGRKPGANSGDFARNFGNFFGREWSVVGCQWLVKGGWLGGDSRWRVPRWNVREANSRGGAEKEKRHSPARSALCRRQPSRLSGGAVLAGCLVSATGRGIDLPASIATIGPARG